MGKAQEFLDLLEGDLFEMANAPKKYTGLKGVVYFCTKDGMKNSQAHSLGRVKLLQDGKSVSVSIKKDKTGKRISIGRDQRMIDDLERFVELNADLLWEYWVTDINKADPAETMKSFEKV